MSEEDIVRGWKDHTFRDSTAAGTHPAGAVDVTGHLHGGRAATEGITTWGCCDSDNSAWSCYFIC